MTISREDVFSSDEFAERRAKTRALMAARGVDTIVLHSPSNIYYLCGHHTLNIWDYQCLILPLESDPFMVLWQFEQGRFEASATDCAPVYFGNTDDPIAATANAMRDRGCLKGIIGMEAQRIFLPKARHDALADAFGTSVVDISGLVEDVRSVKSAAEIAVMRQAASGTDAAMRAALDVIAEGVTDREITQAFAGVLIGASTQGFTIFPMIAVGERSGTPHHAQNGAVVKSGDTVFLECSPAINWYHSPLMRTAVLGAPRDPFAEEVASVGSEALEAMVATMRPGALASDVAKVGTKVVDRIRERILFHDFYGYSVGIGFPPTWIEEGEMQIVATNDRPLQPGMTFHFPMTLRKKGVFGVGQSRTVVVTESGAEVLTQLPLGFDRL
ncbi:MAG: aminopeptidase P family protein [Rhodobacteraceae bacterium]|nr:aminopeptidase P family protein [Paracoccaceae bacterium]